MSKKKISIFLVILIFILCFIFFIPKNKDCTVVSIVSPTSIRLENSNFNITDLESFDDTFSERNKVIAKSLGIKEIDAFVLGNLSKYWAKNLLEGRSVIIENNDLIFNKSSYKIKFMYSGFCLKNAKPYYEDGFKKQLINISKGHYKVIDTETDKIYSLEDKGIRTLKSFVVIKKSQIPRYLKKKKAKTLNKPPFVFEYNNFKVILSDHTSKFTPDKKCQTLMCKEILANINNSKQTIDIAIYGYSTVPAIEQALSAAQKRGVKIRLVYDTDSKGNNIYENTDFLTQLITQNSSDKNSLEVNSIMHNKFYIFDDKITITGSANLSNTDMSGFNSNAIIVINSEAIAKIYKTEFEQMINGLFHNAKIKNKKVTNDKNIQILFSPKDKIITNAIIPLINDAKNYIYIPTFLITDKNITEALIRAKKRNVDVKIIVDSLNASTRHTKHKILRSNNIPVKTENYAGKMHSKSIIIDDKYTIIGSMNFSNSGENINDENVVIITNSGLAKFYKNFFLYQWAIIDDKWLKYNARAEGKDSIGSCNDGIDNNYDGLIDTEDPACK